MEQDWRRGRAVLDLSLSQVKALVAGSGFMVESAEPIQEGLANTNYRLVDAEGRQAHLRISQRDPKTLDLECALAEALPQEIPIPRLLFRSPSAPVALFEWLPGRTIQRHLAEGGQRDVLEAAPQLGRVLAQIASRKFPSAGFLGPDLTVAEPWPSVFDGLRGFLEYALGNAALEPELADRIVARWSRDEAEIRHISREPCLSHADYKPANILIENGQVTGVLDWEFAHSGTWLLDAGQMLRYLGSLRDEFAFGFEAGLKDGGLEPPPQWVELARTIDLASLVDLYGRKEAGDRQRADVLSLIQGTLAQMTQGQ
jgi:aminoglycoside phosphotransferase (APT) family kinase protein